MMKKYYIYKYRPDNEFTIKLLHEKRLHFSNPTEFEDSTDCQPMNINFDVNEIINNYALTKDKKTQEYINNNKTELIRQVFNNSARETLYAKTREAFNSLYILSMTDNPISPYMWENYADGNQGLCLAFYIMPQEPFLKNSQIEYVRYNRIKDELLKLTHMDKSKQDVSNIIFGKFKNFESEREIRIAKTPEQMIINGVEQNSFTPNALAEIYFGIKMKPERETFYKLLCKKCGLNHVKFYKMTMPNDETDSLLPIEV